MASVEEPASATEKVKKPTKVFNDSVHGHIEMHPLLVKIIDTPAFQRLRNIKQLGGGYFVYPGASHNRFEHSIGVAHLAGQLVKSLRDRQGLGITEEDVLCVQIAGLCHDLGHGPFSHTFENYMKKRGLEWEHEKQSIKMFEQLIDGDIEKTMRNEYNLGSRDIQFIKELINPTKKKGEPTSSEWKFSGRPKEKGFLYQIVANKTTGIDVDKMDYFSRDCLHLGMRSNFSHERYMMFARVCTKEKVEKTAEEEDKQTSEIIDKTQICMRDKEAINMYELFHIRNILHQTAYQHRVTKAVEMMILDALLTADEKIFKIQMSENENTIDPNCFMNLTDDVLQQILSPTSPKAQNLINRIKQRKLYKLIGSRLFTPNNLKPLDKAEERKEKLNSWMKPALNLKADEFEITTVKFDYGMGEKDPIEELRFYRKTDENIAVKLTREEVSYMLPVIFKEVKVMLFYKGGDGDVENRARVNIDSLWAELLTVDQ